MARLGSGRRSSEAAENLRGCVNFYFPFIYLKLKLQGRAEAGPPVLAKVKQGLAKVKQGIIRLVDIKHDLMGLDQIR